MDPEEYEMQLVQSDIFLNISLYRAMDRGYAAAKARLLLMYF